MKNSNPAARGPCGVVRLNTKFQVIGFTVVGFHFFIFSGGFEVVICRSFYHILKLIFIICRSLRNARLTEIFVCSIKSRTCLGEFIFQ